MSSSSSSRPLPRLPLETQAAILRHCDPSTLAVGSRVCLAWLELAGPILYEHITNRSKDQLEMMIRSEAVLASIAPFVSLDQTRSFTYRLDRDAQDELADVTQSLARTPALITELVIDLREASGPYHETHVPTLLASFDPGRLHVLDQPTAYNRVRSFMSLTGAHRAWSQLRKATFTHSTPSGHFVEVLRGRARPVDLLYDLSLQRGRDDDVWRALEFVCDDLDPPGQEGHDKPAFGRVQVWVHDEQEVTLANRMLVDCSCTSLDIGVKTLPRPPV